MQKYILYPIATSGQLDLIFNE